MSMPASSAAPAIAADLVNQLSSSTTSMPASSAAPAIATDLVTAAEPELDHGHAGELGRRRRSPPTADPVTTAELGALRSPSTW